MLFDANANAATVAIAVEAAIIIGLMVLLLCFQKISKFHQMVLSLTKCNQLNKRLQPQSMPRNFINEALPTYRRWWQRSFACV